MIHRAVPFEGLRSTDLDLDVTYCGGAEPNAAADPINRLLPVGNQGGFRMAGSKQLGGCTLLALYTDGQVADWPDTIDYFTGRFTYYGDNRRPGAKLHETGRGGNHLLSQIFEALHSDPPRREAIPPIFVFEKASPDAGRDVVFRGLAVPGSVDATPMEDLVAVWKTSGHSRFQNYRAVFTILECDSAPRAWIDDVIAGNPLSGNCPSAWREWCVTGRYRPLRAARTTEFRSREEQLPTTEEGNRIIRATHKFFDGNPYAFEHCAARLWQMSAPNVSAIDVTRPSRDGGRDAVGLYGLGPQLDPIQLDFALEAKCYELSHGVGVRETSRLISRLKHRQFGVFVTTSYVSKQAYQELREDKHPVVVLAARDIVELLQQHQHGSTESVEHWLNMEFRQ